MSADLVSAIDAAVAYVRERLEPITNAEVDRFGELAADVYHLAFAAGLVEALPKVSELRSDLESTDPPLPPVRFETKLNLPGDWDVVRDAAYEKLMAEPLKSSYSLTDELPEPPKHVFVFCDSARWYNDMEVLKSLASGQATMPPADLLDALLDDAMMSHTDMANKLKLNPEALRSRLQRWRNKNKEGWQEITEPKARQPRYLYRVGAVRHLLRDALANE